MFFTKILLTIQSRPERSAAEIYDEGRSIQIPFLKVFALCYVEGQRMAVNICRYFDWSIHSSVHASIANLIEKPPDAQQ